ncbi:putative 60S ribosomal protein L39-like 5 [Lutra lutra]|uniref:putative 60S ribosomal protein L39-like 5 n=1 Tax=Lutra lutra TaxID=9657 RepID=UPI001FD04E8A|nr:putative 60S ribosomal protein L39-like 5 [Lutra lutra]
MIGSLCLILSCQVEILRGRSITTVGVVDCSLPVSTHKTLKIKQFLAKKQKQNHPIPQWIQMITGNKIRYNSKRTHWRKTKLGL